MSRQRVGIIITDMGGDASFEIVSEKDYNIVISEEFTPTKKWKSMYKDKEENILDTGKYQDKIGEYFYDAEKDSCNDKVLKRFVTQTFCPEKIDLSEYNVIGILTLPGD